MKEDILDNLFSNEHTTWAGEKCSIYVCFAEERTFGRGYICESLTNDIPIERDKTQYEIEHVLRTLSTAI